MAQSTTALTSTPKLVAIGPGNAMFQGVDTTVSYRIGGIVSAPTAIAFRIGTGVREPMYLADGEGLWLSGDGIAAVYAEVEPS